MNWSLLTFLCGALLLLTCWNHSLNTPRPNWWQLPTPAPSLLNDQYQDRTLSGLVHSYTTGNKRRLSRKAKSIHQDLGLMHLLTPSGLHLSVIWKFFTPLLTLFFARLLWPKRVCFGVSTLVLFFSDSLWAMQRMSLFRLISSFLPQFKIKLFVTFVTTFVFSFLLGNFHSSPLSFALSFLFFGIILSAQGSFPKLCMGLLASQALVQSIFMQPYSIFGSFLGIFITPIFALIFPLMLLDYWLLSHFQNLNLEFIIKVYYHLLEKLHQFSHNFEYSVYDPLLSFSLAFIFLSKSRSLKYIGILFLVLTTKPLVNLPPRAYLSEVQTVSHTRHRLYFPPDNIERTPRGYKTWDEHQVCYHRILMSQFERSCRNL